MQHKNGEALQRVENTEQILKRQAAITNSEYPKYPRQAKNARKCDSNSKLRNPRASLFFCNLLAISTGSQRIEDSDQNSKVCKDDDTNWNKKRPIRGPVGDNTTRKEIRKLRYR